MAEVTVKLNRLRMSPRKLRLVADTVRRQPAQWATEQLTLSPKRAARPLLKLVTSGIAAAKNKNLELTNLLIKELRVDEGQRLKRWLPAPRGRTYQIRKPTSHITLTVSDERTNDGKTTKRARNNVKAQSSNVKTTT